MRPEWTVVDEADSVVFFATREETDRSATVVLAGHVDTVPRGGAPVAAIEGACVVGRGAADMKSGVAVMLELAESIAKGDIDTDLDVALLFFGREELPFKKSALMPYLRESERARTADLAIVLEPTSNGVEVGCLGNLNVRVTVRGAAAHSARPWLGENAIHHAISALGSIVDLPVRDVDVDGLVYREAISVTSIRGGAAGNVVPDFVTADVNFRYAPRHSPGDAEARVRELLGHRKVALEVLGNAPPGLVPIGNALVDRLRRAGDLPVAPKQAWTPVAEFGMVGVDAINFGPGDPRYAHADDERVRKDALVRSYEVLRSFLSEDGAAKEPIA
jgi:succinyl-diaminopimelate desuccinylase